MILAGSGIVAGLGGAWVARRLMATRLFEISATDPLVMVGAPLLLGLVAFLAILLPALRSTRIDLSHTLRVE